MELLQGGGSLAHVRVAAAKEVVGEYTIVCEPTGGTVVVVVADATHEGGVFDTEHRVALVLRVGAQQMEAHEIALPHLVGVGQQGVEEGQRRVWPGIHQAVGAVEDGAVLWRCAGEEHHGQQKS